MQILSTPELIPTLVISLFSALLGALTGGVLSLLITNQGIKKLKK